MDVLNFISWLKSKKQVTTVDASQTLIPLGLKDPRRDDGYIAGAISVQDLASSFVPPILPNGNTAYGVDAFIQRPINSIFNTAIGSGALYYNTYGINNTALGFNALTSNTAGNYNVGVGFGSLQNNTTGESNTAIGYYALMNNSTGIYNTFVGISAGTGITTGSGNVGLGWGTLSGGPNGTGQNNIGIGQTAGENVGAANFSIAIGSGTQINGHSCSIVLGQNASATASNQLVIGSQFAGENIGTIATETLTLTKSWTVRINGVNYKIPLQVA